MRKSRDGHLLVELAKGARSEEAAGKFGAAIHKELGVAQLGVFTELEIVDIDAAATKEEVLEAVRSVIPGDSSNPAVLSERLG